MYLIPGCVGRGVKLGSENSSGGAPGAGGVWKSGNLEIWDLEIWEFGDLDPGNQESWGPKNNKYKLSNPNPLCPKCRQGLD